MKNIIETYENYDEESRLKVNKGRRIEFITSVRAINEIMPDKVRILDCASGTGIYSCYYAEKGHQVTALDITPKYIEIINEKIQRMGIKMETGVNDATNLSLFEDESFDVVLCMGPMYHLTDVEFRNRCISECRRILRNNGILCVAYINRYFVFQYVAMSDKNYICKELANKLLQVGSIKYGEEDCFWTDAYFHKTEEIEEFMIKYGFEVLDHLASDGISPMIKEKVDACNDEEYEIWCDYHYKICRERSVLGATNHGLIIGKKNGEKIKF